MTDAEKPQKEPKKGLCQDVIPQDIHNHIFLFDIDGVLCEPQKAISLEMINKINALARVARVYIVTGNSYTKARDMLDGIHFDGIFTHNGDELRAKSGRLIWKDIATKPLPATLERTLVFLLYGKDIVAPNRIEWRSPRFVNFAPVGRFANNEQRSECDMSWREDTIAFLKDRYPEADIFAGGSVSIDICSKGADKSRAGIVLGEMCDENIIFVGDKTSEGGNDYPLCQWIEKRGKKTDRWLTSTGTTHTMAIVDLVLERLA